MRGKWVRGQRDSSLRGGWMDGWVSEGVERPARGRERTERERQEEERERRKGGRCANRLLMGG